MSWYSVSQNRCASMSACSPGMSPSGSGCNKPHFHELLTSSVHRLDEGPLESEWTGGVATDAVVHTVLNTYVKSSTVLVSAEESKKKFQQREKKFWLLGHEVEAVSTRSFDLT